MKVNLEVTPEFILLENWWLGNFLRLNMQLYEANVLPTLNVRNCAIIMQYTHLTDEKLVKMNEESAILTINVRMVGLL